VDIKTVVGSSASHVPQMFRLEELLSFPH